MKRITSIILAVLIFFAPVQGLAVENEIPNLDILFLNSILEMVNEKYPFEINGKDMVTGGAKGILQSVDPYSNYYTKEEAQSLMETTMGEIVGVGVAIKIEDGRVIVGGVIKDSPAEKAGIQIGDIIVSVDDQMLTGLTISEVSARIKGKKGTQVKITLLRGEKYLDFNLKRQEIKLNPVEFEMVEDNIAYIKIGEFSQGVSKEVGKILKEIDKKNSKKLILDLRNNPGGLLDEATDLLKMLVGQGDLVHIKYKDGFETIKSNLKKEKYDIVVLVNENSASASEVVAGAIKDRKTGKLVGTRTYGKATVQSLIPVTDGSLIKLTIAEYLLPNKESINKVGINPDYPVKNVGEMDLQLKKAIELLKK